MPKYKIHEHFFQDEKNYNIFIKYNGKEIFINDRDKPSLIRILLSNRNNQYLDIMQNGVKRMKKKQKFLLINLFYLNDLGEEEPLLGCFYFKETKKWRTFYTTKYFQQCRFQNKIKYGNFIKIGNNKQTKGMNAYYSSTIKINEGYMMIISHLTRKFKIEITEEINSVIIHFAEASGAYNHSKGKQINAMIKWGKAYAKYETAKLKPLEKSTIFGHNACKNICKCLKCDCLQLDNINNKICVCSHSVMDHVTKNVFPDEWDGQHNRPNKLTWEEITKLQSLTVAWRKSKEKKEKKEMKKQQRLMKQKEVKSQKQQHVPNVAKAKRKKRKRRKKRKDKNNICQTPEQSENSNDMNNVNDKNKPQPQQQVEKEKVLIAAQIEHHKNLQLQLLSTQQVTQSQSAQIAQNLQGHTLLYQQALQQGNYNIMYVATLQMQHDQQLQQYN
eukprot:1865_1